MFVPEDGLRMARGWLEDGPGSPMYEVLYKLSGNDSCDNDSNNNYSHYTDFKNDDSFNATLQLCTS